MMFRYPWNTRALTMLRTEGQECVFLNANKRLENSSIREMAIKSYILDLLDLFIYLFSRYPQLT